MSILTLSSKKSLSGNLRIPGDKSISHRGLLFGALASGVTHVEHLLKSGDVLSTASCLRAMGVAIEIGDTLTKVTGVGLQGLKSPNAVLDCGNSGTTMRLLMGILSGQKFNCTLTGDSSLVKRPMKRVAEPLRLMGAEIELERDNFAPLKIVGKSLHGIEYDLKVASAQIKSAILLAGLQAKGTTKITGEIHSRDHTELLLPHFGVEVISKSDSVSIQGGQNLSAAKVIVPGDPSTAAFWIAGALMVPGGHVKLTNVGLNPSRTGFIKCVERMGADIKIHVTQTKPEVIGDIEIRYSKLKGVTVSNEEVPSLIDELPILAVLASQASGKTKVTGAEELRVKETDRIEAVATNLKKMGIEIETLPDGYIIEGPQKLKGSKVNSYHDHRIAMAFSIASLVATGETQIEEPDCVGISYPEFYEHLKELSS